VPRLEVSRSKTIGQTQSVQFGTAYAFTDGFRPGQVYTYRFSVGELKRQIRRRRHGMRRDVGGHYLGQAFVSDPW